MPHHHPYTQGCWLPRLPACLPMVMVYARLDAMRARTRLRTFLRWQRMSPVAQSTQSLHVRLHEHEPSPGQARQQWAACSEHGAWRTAHSAWRTGKHGHPSAHARPYQL